MEFAVVAAGAAVGLLLWVALILWVEPLMWCLMCLPVSIGLVHGHAVFPVAGAVGSAIAYGIVGEVTDAWAVLGIAGGAGVAFLFLVPAVSAALFALFAVLSVL